MDPAKIEKNPGRRSLAKLMLNSFWGKFGQRANQTQVSTCSNPTQFFQILQDDKQNIHRIEIMNEEMVEVYHSYKEETIPAQTNTNIFVATERDIPVGNYLGQYTSELDTGDAIQEFVAAGPKNHAYVTKQGKQCCKVRGFTLNVRGSSVLNFGPMRDLVLNEILDREEDEEEETTLMLNNPHKIVRCPSTKQIKTIPQDKTYKLVFDKRVVDFDTFQSYPYGYKAP